MTCNINTKDGTKTGLDEIVYTLTPPAESDFENPIKVEFSKEPKNIFEEIGNIFKIIFKFD